LIVIFRAGTSLILFRGSQILLNTPYKSRPYDMFLSEEVDFLKAELFARNLVAGDAKAAYEAGVEVRRYISA